MVIQIPFPLTAASETWRGPGETTVRIEDSERAGGGSGGGGGPTGSFVQGGGATAGAGSGYLAAVRLCVSERSADVDRLETALACEDAVNEQSSIVPRPTSDVNRRPGTELHSAPEPRISPAPLVSPNSDTSFEDPPREWVRARYWLKRSPEHWSATRFALARPLGCLSSCVWGFESRGSALPGRRCCWRFFPSRVFSQRAEVRHRDCRRLLGRSLRRGGRATGLRCNASS